MSSSEEANTNNIFASLRKLRKSAEDLRILEKADNNARAAKKLVIDPLWNNYGENSQPYEDDYGTLIPEENLKSHIVQKAEEYRQRGIPYCVLDLFAPIESWLATIQNKSLAINGGVAVTLNDPRKDESKIKADERRRLFCVEGDITMPEVRKELHQTMSVLGIQDVGFGMVMARPYGGAFIAEDDKEYNLIYYSLLRQAWRITSKQEGEIFCPVPESLSYTPTLHKWIDLVRNDVHAEVKLSNRQSHMKITKHLNSNNKLPDLSVLI